MLEQFLPSWMSCLDEPMMIWLNKYIAPGFMCVPRKPHPFGNEWHSIACVLHSMIFWLDVDTIIWDRQRTIESFLPSDSQVSMVAQLDLHRSMESKYFNAGVLLIRKTDWMMDILRQAYRQWQIPIFQGLFYFDADQDAMNLAMAKSDVAAASRDGGSGKGSTAGRLDDHLDLKRYGQLWTLGKDRNQKPFVLHFPNCVNGRCAPEYLRLYRQAMDMKV